MAFECYSCFYYVGAGVNNKGHFKTTDIIEAATWCSEMFFATFNDSPFVGASCMYIDTECGPVDFPFSFYRNGSMVVDDNNMGFVFMDETHGKKLVTVDELIEWVLSIVNE